VACPAGWYDMRLWAFPIFHYKRHVHAPCHMPIKMAMHKPNSYISTQNKNISVIIAIYSSSDI